MTTELDQAAWLLVEIAGPAPQHIEMSSRGPKKYYTVARPLTLNDAREHLRGVKTRGALCQYGSGQARALAYDADDAEHWQILRQAARKLAETGYKPLLEPSPRGRGGHLWLIFSALVDAIVARSHAHSIAPELEQITEYWPGLAGVSGWNRVRLPGGRYVAPGFSAWCRLHDGHGQELTRDGMSAARVLLEQLTPAELLPAGSADQQADRDASSSVTVSAPDEICDARSAATTTTYPQQPAKRNRSQLRNDTSTANRFLWFRYTPAQLAAWFNARHALLEELHPQEHSGMAYSPSVDERTPSTSYHKTRDGERWTDFSARARRGDGHPDGGDALELYVRLEGGSKAAILRELGREMVQEARTELERAARSGTQPPLWVAEIVTDAGREHYRQLRVQSRKDRTS